MSFDQKDLKNKNFYESLFEKFPDAGRRGNHNEEKARASPTPHKPRHTGENTTTMDAIKKELLKRSICKKLNVPWSHQLAGVYRLDKADWTQLTAAWKTDSLNRDLLFGTIMTENDYQRIQAKDKKKLFIVFHPDKNRAKASHDLYNIIFKKVNQLYHDYKKIPHKIVNKQPK